MRVVMAPAGSRAELGNLSQRAAVYGELAAEILSVGISRDVTSVFTRHPMVLLPIEDSAVVIDLGGGRHIRGRALHRR